MSRRLGLLALLAAVVGLVAVVVWVILQPRGTVETPPGPEAEPTAEPEHEITLEAGPGEIVHSDESGEVVWSAKFGGSITIDEQRRHLKYTDVVWELERSGLTDLSVRAPIMEADYESRLLTFSEGVDIQARGGEARFVTDELRYEFDTEKLIGEGEVAVSYGGFTLTGTKLVIDNRAGKVRVSNGTLRLN